MYVGHTTNWDKRKWTHKYHCINGNSSKHNVKLYQMIRENDGRELFKMIEVEKYPCNDKREAEKRECEVMKELNAILNSIESYVSEEGMKEKGKIQHKKYRELNKEKQKERMKQYRELNKEK